MSRINLFSVMQLNLWPWKFLLSSQMFKVADIVQEQGVKVAVIMSSCPRCSSSEVSHLLVQGFISVFHILFAMAHLALQ